MNLHEWTKIFLKQRDLVKREIKSIEETINGFCITKKDGQQNTVLVVEELTNTITEEVNYIICLNTKKNTKYLADKWEDFAKHEQLMVVFANPVTNEKWLIKPHHHNKIADKKSLQQGLMAMYDAISAI